MSDERNELKEIIPLLLHGFSIEEIIQGGFIPEHRIIGTKFEKYLKEYEKMNNSPTRIVKSPDSAVPDGSDGFCIRWRDKENKLTQTIHIWVDREKLTAKIEEYIISEGKMLERKTLGEFSLDPEEYV